MMTQFEILQPQTVTEVCDCLDKYGAGALLHAGGTDLLVRLREKALTPSHIVDLSKVDSLRSVQNLPGNILRIGSMATISKISSQKIIGDKFQALCDALNSIGSPQIRNRGTMAGNICNASPAADCLPPLLVYEAVLNIAGKSGSRTLPMDEFVVGPGTNALCHGEFLESVDLKIPEGHCASAYQKLGRRKAVDCSIVGVAVRLFADQSVMISFGAVAAKPFRAESLEKLMKGNTLAPTISDRLSACIHSEIAPIDDIRASREYRENMSFVLFKKVYQSAKSRLDKEWSVS